VLESGAAIWLRGADGSADHEVTIVGQAVAAASAGAVITEGFHLLSFPYSCSVALNDLTFLDDNATKAGEFDDIDAGDRIYVWNGSGYNLYGLHFDGSWRASADWWGGSATTDSLNLGDGFWYRAKAPGFTWDEDLPYPDAF
jgi:hypothetical protein